VAVSDRPGESAVPRLGPAALLGLAALETAGRASVPASVLLLSRGATSLAAAAAASALVATVGRGFASSLAIERLLRATFGATFGAARRLALASLRAERKIGLLAEAAREAAVYEASFVPVMAAHAVLIVLTWGALVGMLGALWSLAIAAAAAPIVIVLGLGARRIRQEQQAAWDVFGELAIGMRLLVEACVELRAHEREPSFSRSLSETARAFARAERRANVWSAALASTASAIVLLAALTPAGSAVAGWVAGVTGRRAAEIAIVGGIAIYFAVGLGKLLEQRARYAPFRATLRRFLAEPDALAPGAALPGDDAPEAPLPPLASATIRLRGVSCRHKDATRATPERLSYTWGPGRGLLLTGANGAGKSTLVLALLGLIAPSEGAIEIDGAPLEGERARALRRRCAYLAQSPFVEPGATVAWHLRLFSREPIPDERIDRALERAGLARVLAEHAARGATAAPPRDVLAGELSGGERQRMHIARILAQDAEVVVLDEPEAGLDREARLSMAALVEELAATRRVLLIAHDPAIVPASFERLEIRAGAPSTERGAHGT
jgi:ABC-type transport system involved in cytochrome bd biosynthesis fused ATPase/permease subunit